MVDGISNVRCFVRVSNYLYEIWDPPEIWDRTELLGIVFHIWRLFFLFLTVIGNCLLFWEVINHPLPSRLFEQTVGLHAFQKMVLFEPDDYWGVRQDKCISPFCRQENGNQSGCQEMVRAGAPAIYSGHLCVSSFSSPASWAGDSTDRWVGPCRWGRRFRQWGWRAAPGAFLH